MPVKWLYMESFEELLRNEIYSFMNRLQCANN